MTNNIVILGSTGSIGVQALEVCRSLGINVVGITADKNVKLLEEQARKFKPKIVAIANEKYGPGLKQSLSDTGIKVVWGKEALIDAVTVKEADTVLTSVVGIAGLKPTVAAIESGKNIALANKETLVTAGSIVTNTARKMGVKIIPVDSEHSAIFQCIQGEKNSDIEKIILTASGGPFRGYTLKELEKVTLSQALKHPNWSMGSKITIDSATMMNKGLEVIEARWLFNLEKEKIEVVIHPESIIHSMVLYIDGSVIAQMGIPDMKLPIQYALTYPKREKSNFERLNLPKLKSLSFEEPDMETFVCLRYAFDALEIGGTMPVVLNAANEVAVELFLEEKIPFLGIMRIIENAMGNHKVNSNPDLNDIIELDKEIRMQLKIYK